MELKQPAVLRELIQMMSKKSMAPFPPGLTDKDKLSECLKELNVKNCDTLTTSILDGSRAALGMLIWRIFF
jgi:hypothetical protein